MKIQTFTVLLFLSLLLSQRVQGGEERFRIDFSSEFGVEHWQFVEPFDQDSMRGITTLFGEFDLNIQLNEAFRFKLNPRFLMDMENEDRSRIVPPRIEDLYLDYYSPHFELRAGYQIFSWKTVESYSPADFLNQVDREEDLLNPGKMGELALRARYIVQFEKEYEFEFYYLPVFQPTHLPRVGNEYYFLPIKKKVSTKSSEHDYTSDMGIYMPQFALKFGQTIFDSFDMSLFYFYGYDRFPGLNKVGPFSGATISQQYRPIMKAGLTFQGQVGDWLLKGEGVFNHLPKEVTQGDKPLKVAPYFVYTTGFEYTFYGLISPEHDLGLIVELIGDTDLLKDRMKDLETFRPFGSHVFVGLRYTFNNVSDRTFLMGGFANYLTGIQDQEHEIIYNAEYQERLYKNFSIKFRLSDLIVTDKCVTGAPTEECSSLSAFDEKMRLDAEAIISF